MEEEQRSKEVKVEEDLESGWTDLHWSVGGENWDREGDTLPTPYVLFAYTKGNNVWAMAVRYSACGRI